MRNAGAVIDDPTRLRRHIGPDFGGPIGIADVESAYASIVPGREYQIGRYETSRAVFIQIVRPEMAALLDVVDFGRNRERRDADRIGRHADIEDPDPLDAVGAIPQCGFVGYYEQIAFDERQRVVRSPAVGRTPVAVGDELRRRPVREVEQRDAAIPPSDIGRVSRDQP